VAVNTFAIVAGGWLDKLSK